jgi:hypothetical protein
VCRARPRYCFAITGRLAWETFSAPVDTTRHEANGGEDAFGPFHVSKRQQSTDRQVADLLVAGGRRDDLYVDHGVSGARASRPQFDRALDALIEGDTLVITTLDRLGRSTQNMLAFADELRSRGAGLRVLNLGGGDVDARDTHGVDVVHDHGRSRAK